MTKQELLKEINQHITRVSNLDPPPVDYLDKLQNFKTLVQIATPAELTHLAQQWQRIITVKSNAQHHN